MEIGFIRFWQEHRGGQRLGQRPVRKIPWRWGGSSPQKWENYFGCELRGGGTGQELLKTKKMGEMFSFVNFLGQFLCQNVRGEVTKGSLTLLQRGVPPLVFDRPCCLIDCVGWCCLEEVFGCHFGCIGCMARRKHCVIFMMCRRFAFARGGFVSFAFPMRVNVVFSIICALL